jgi:hypothetical protein
LHSANVRFFAASVCFVCVLMLYVERRTLAKLKREKREKRAEWEWKSCFAPTAAEFVGDSAWVTVESLLLCLLCGDYMRVDRKML